eukprot:Nitzschia sp. Nitz4//scaffold164_size50480//13886//15137//NITZ4_007000-RA/size50480-processed-gene-0.65-mRNA-1//1//CDS//3329538068//4244//frame0
MFASFGVRNLFSPSLFTASLVATGSRSFSATSTAFGTMKAAVIRETGNADVLKIETDFPKPTLKAGQVLVKNEVAGLNFIDTYFRTGLYKRETPFVCGLEGGGIVEEVSEEAAAEGIQVGDRVAYYFQDSYAEYTAVPINKVVPVPDEVDMGTATACIVQGLTAHYLVTSATANLIQPGEWCLIYAVGGGTCQWAAQMAKILGYKVIGTVSKGKEQIAKATGCDALIVLDEVEGKSYSDYTSVDIPARVMEITNGVGVKCVIDGIGKSTVDMSMNSLAARGIFISFGNASGAVPPFPLLSLVSKSAFVTRPTLAHYTATREEMLSRAKDVFQWIKEGKLKVNIDTTFALDEVAAGHKYLEDGKSKGKVLFKVMSSL